MPTRFTRGGPGEVRAQIRQFFSRVGQHDQATRAHREPSVRETQVVVGGTAVWTGAQHGTRTGEPWR